MGTALKAVYMQSNKLFVRRNLLQYTEGGGKTKYCIIKNFLSHTLTGARREWPYIDVCIYKIIICIKKYLKRVVGFIQIYDAARIPGLEFKISII
jgi:hypothetical protein